MSYISSHDDQHSYDRERAKTYDTAFKLMLAPGGVQIYYGDELARPMYAKQETIGDAHLRTFMNWEDLNEPGTRDLLAHWQKLGQFRQQQDAVGSGVHQQLSDSPYVFKRTLDGETIVVAKDIPEGQKTISVPDSFANGTRLYDYYSLQEVVVKDNKVTFSSDFSYALLGQISRGQRP